MSTAARNWTQRSTGDARMREVLSKSRGYGQAPLKYYLFIASNSLPTRTIKIDIAYFLHSGVAAVRLGANSGIYPDMYA